MRHSQTRKLLGTLIEVTVLSEDPKTPDRIACVFDYFSSVEQEFSRFLPHSTLSILNKNKKASVSPRFLELLEISRDMYWKTGGLFNPLASAAKLGYTRSFEEGNFETSAWAVDTDFGAVRIEGNTILLRPGQSLDFGGIAKGWAVDNATSLLRSFGYGDFFINAGGDIFASGKNGETRNGWTIGIENPFTGETIASVTLQDTAIATSGSYKRHWDIGEKTYHHLVNPHTGENENAIVSVSIIAPQCARADGLTKSVFNLPVPEGLELMKRSWLDGIVFTATGEVFCTQRLQDEYGLVFAGVE